LSIRTLFIINLLVYQLIYLKNIMKKFLARIVFLSMLLSPIAFVLPTGASAADITLSAQDFGVVSANGLKGYSAGFGLTGGATFSGVQALTIQLYSGNTLLQTDNATPLVGTNITGTQISSPFDVFGTFDYNADGYWSNSRESEYGQTLIPTEVFATVRLADGTVLSASNSTLTGDPSTLFSSTPPTTVNVTVEKYVDGVLATTANTNSADFQMTSTTTASNNVQITGNYELNSADSYQSVSSDMAVGIGYTTNEIIDGTTVGVTGSGTAPYELLGYTYGATLAEAAAATPTLTAPNFANLTNNEFVIVWNKKCTTFVPPSTGSTGTINGTVTGGTDLGVGVLAVTGVTAVNTVATADGTFTNGWKYTFNVTVPTNETHLSMKFADWMSDVGSHTLGVANNMRISSAQADNSGATVLLTGANTYSTPTLNMTGDLDPTIAGDQVQVTVEVAVPLTTINGSYSTNYGILTQ
jgi:hypothetical protein